MRLKMFIPFDHKQYIEADKRQLRSKFSCRNFFQSQEPTPEISGFSKSQLATQIIWLVDKIQINFFRCISVIFHVKAMEACVL